MEPKDTNSSGTWWWSTRPGAAPAIFVFTIFLSLGIALGESVGLDRTWLVLTPIPVVAAFHRARWAPWLIICSAAFIIGFLLVGMSIRSLQSGLLYSLADEPRQIPVSARVIDDPSSRSYGLSFQVLADRAWVDGVEWKIAEKIQVRAYGDPTETGLIEGDRIKFRATPRIPASFSGFDWRRHLTRRGVGVEASISLDDVEVIGPHGNRSLSAWRNFVKRSAEDKVGPARAGLLSGVTLGDKKAIPPGVAQNFRDSGLGHTLAVSGLHIGLVTACCWFLLKALRIPAFLQAITLVCAVLYYVLLAGAPPSALRAGMMALLAVAAWHMGRQVDRTASLSSAALCILLYDPFYLFHVGFQLSFAAAFGLTWLVPILDEVFSTMSSVLRGPFCAGLAAQIAVSPILAYYFGEISLVAIPATVSLLPALVPTLMLGLLAPFAAAASPLLGWVFYQPLKATLAYMIFIAEIFSAPTWAALFVESLKPWEVLLYYLGVALVFGLIKFTKPKVAPVSLLIVCLALVLVASCLQVGFSPAPEGLEVIFFDVGQGDAMLLQTADNARVLIDGGEDKSFIRRRLKKQGVNHLNALVLSHPHADHVGGLAEVVDSGPTVELVLDIGFPHPTPSYISFLEAIERTGVPYMKLRAGQKYKFGDDLYMEVLHPTDIFMRGTRSDPNNNSAVLRVSYGAFSLLLTGDIEQEAEAVLLRRGAELAATVLKVPHHGSATSSTESFVGAVSPRVAVISVGQDNSFGHPADSAVARLNAVGAAVYRTDIDGDVTIRSDGASYVVLKERRR